ncbi:MAG TPA: hypothetical protein PKW37_03135 [Salinivirgaceae bacterium]|nr:hypothetical protein [Salinivirgaceae bacterium]
MFEYLKMLNIKNRLTIIINYCCIALLLFTFIPFVTRGQDVVKANLANNAVTYNSFNDSLLSELILNGFNEFRNKCRLDSLKQNQFLKSAALELLNLEKNRENRQNRSYNQQDALKDILIKCGGSGIGFGISGITAIDKENSIITYQNLASNIVVTELIKPNINKQLSEKTSVLAGVACELSDDGNQLFYCIVIGNYLSENKGVNHISELLFEPYKNRVKLKPYDSRECKRLERLSDYYPDIYDGLKVEKGELIFNFPDNRHFKSFASDEKSGVVVDVFMYEQFLNPQYNIVDYAEVGRGYLTKEIKLSATPSKKGKKRQPSVLEQISFGKMPSLPSENYEINLILTQNGTACAIIPPFYIEKFSGDYKSALQLLADTITINADFAYNPLSDTTVRNIRIPFKVNEYSYEDDEIDRLLSYLDEFNTVVKRVKVTAYSSIEGNVKENELLQSKRAETVVDALKRRQKEGLISQIVTKTNWEQFKSDILSTDYSFLASETLEDAQEYIKTHNLNRELEPILSKHRYAQVDIEVVNDLANEKEEAFVVRRFNNAIESKDLPLALAVQKYIIKSILDGRYPANFIEKLNIPFERPFAGMLMNSLYIKIISEGGEITNYTKQIEDLHKLNPQNEYILYNILVLKVLNYNNLVRSEVDKIQEQIQSLYYKTFTKNAVDILNMSFQIKIIQLADSVRNGEQFKQAAINRIKKTFDNRGESPENALRIASFFIDIKDYSYAKQILDPYIFDNNYDKEMAFCWVSLCSIFPENLLTRQFAKVMERLYEQDSSKLCDLFNKKHLTITALENPDVKNLFLQKCKCNLILDDN